MLREIVLLALGAIFGLGATMTAAVAPTYLPNMPPWAVHWLFWGGIALMAIMTVDAGCLILWRPRSMTALFLDLGLFFLAAAAISQFSPIPSPQKQREPHNGDKRRLRFTKFSVILLKMKTGHPFSPLPMRHDAQMKIRHLDFHLAKSHSTTFLAPMRLR